MLKIRDVQNLESQRQKKNVSLEETLEALTELYLEKKDPVRKAKRQKARGKLPSPSGQPIDTLTHVGEAKKETSKPPHLQEHSSQDLLLSEKRPKANFKEKGKL